MRVLVDTSVWSLVLRRQKVRPDPKIDILSELISSGQSVFLTGVILQEILQGIKDQVQVRKLEKHLHPYPLLEPDRQIYQQAARLFSKCRAQGTTVATVDCLIAAVAIAHSCHLLTSDADFRSLAAVSPLKLV